MQTRKYSLVLFISTLLTLLTSQPSKAFRVYYTDTRPDDYMHTYRYPNGDRGITKLDVVDPNTAPFLNPFNLLSAASQPFIQEIQRGGTDGLLDDLNIYKGEGWNFKKGRGLRGSFNVRKLWACGIGKNCGTTRIGGTNDIRNDGIGATFELEYRPSRHRKSRDPKPKADDLYWIQRVITNHPIGSSPGVHKSYIDNRTKQPDGRFTNAIHPYYAFGSKIKPENKSGYGKFYDRPYRIDNLNRNYYWIAELYLAQADESNPFDVTIYNGVRWGWTYEFIRKEDGCNLVSSNGGACPTPPPPPDCNSSGDCSPPPPPSDCNSSGDCSPPPPPPSDCNGASGGGGCYGTDYVESQKISVSSINNDNESQYQNLSFFNFDYFQHNATTIPESTPVIGLITLTAWAIVKTLKRKN